MIRCVPVRDVNIGWSDCRIRSYYPESGRLQYIVNKAYGSKVTAVTAYHNCQRFISGSDLGHVIVWEVPEPNYVTDVNHVYKHFLLKEHKAEVTCIQVRRNDSECVTSSIDGSCIIWDLESVLYVDVNKPFFTFVYFCTFFVRFSTFFYIFSNVFFLF